MSYRHGLIDEIWVCHLALVPYASGISIQETLRERRLAGEIPDTLLLLEHPPTYTRGRRSGAQDLPLPESFYRAKGIELHATDRGGRLTYHGPGQLVGYPIVAVDDVVRHVRTIEDAIVAALAQVGIDAHGRAHDGPDYTGVWVGGGARRTARSEGSPHSALAGGGARDERERKIASIGVHVSRGVATHGFAVNVHNDLAPFSWVLACGLPDVQMTSLAAESAGACESLGCFRKRVAYAFCQAHGRRQRLVSPHRLGIDTANAAPRAQRAPINTTSTTEMEPIPA
jgi:lipoate-protein ligase B